MKNPTVSVITSSYNSANYLEASIRSLLSQDYSDFEHLIIDCGSNDGSIEVVRRMQHSRLRLIETEFCGVSAARNIGIEHALGELVAILDSDDLSFESRLSSQVRAFESNRCLVAAGTGIIEHDTTTNRRKTYLYPSKSQTLRLLVRAGMNPIPHSTLMFKKSAYDALGGYSELFQKSEDFDLLVRLSDIGDLTSIGRPLVQYTVRRDSHTNRHRPKGRNAEYYVLLSLLLNSTTVKHEKTKPEILESWIDGLGAKGVNSLLGRWAIKVLTKDWTHLDSISVMRLLKSALKRLPDVIAGTTVSTSTRNYQDDYEHELEALLRTTAETRGN